MGGEMIDNPTISGPPRIGRGSVSAEAISHPTFKEFRRTLMQLSLEGREG